MKVKFLLVLFYLFIINTAPARTKIDSAVLVILKDPIHTAAQSKKIDDIFVLAKVWGFLKYFHPQIASGKYNWDNELIAFLPNYCRIGSSKERSDSLEAWINRFGVVEVCRSCSDSILKGAVLKPDLRWITSSGFSKQLVNKLQFIVKNRKQGDQYYVTFYNGDEEKDLFIPQFQHEASYSKMVFPSDVYSLLSLFRFWNAMEYWYPYKGGMPVSWDNVLRQFIPRMIAQDNIEQYTLSVEELSAALHDGHSVVRSSKAQEMSGRYCMPFTFKMIERKAFVTSILNDSLGKLAGVRVGDVIESIDGKAINEIIKARAPFFSSSTNAAFLSYVPYIIIHSPKEQQVVKIKRKAGEKDCVVRNFLPRFGTQVDWNPPYFAYAQDSAFCKLPNNIGYINMGNLEKKDSVAFSKMISETNGLIIDNRQNAEEGKNTNAFVQVSKLILPPDRLLFKFSSAQPGYPGVFSFAAPVSLRSMMGEVTTENYYKKNIVILSNEATMSIGEFMTMLFRKAPSAIVMGTNTAGADGAINHITLPGNIVVSFSGHGVYYPDGGETQRIGIKPDIYVKQTLAGFADHRDEILEKAIEYLKAKNK